MIEQGLLPNPITRIITDFELQRQKTPTDPNEILKKI